MAIARDNATVATAASPTSLTFSHTVNDNADGHLAVVVCFRANSVPSVSSVTYNGDGLTLVRAQTLTSNRVEIWAMVAPDEGTHDVVISLSDEADLGLCAYAISHTGVDQTTPHGTAVSATGSSSPATVNVSSASDELVIDGVSKRTATGTGTVGAGQTQEMNATAGSMDGFGSTEPGAATVTMSWTFSSVTGWAIAAVPLKPAAGGGGGSIQPPRSAHQFRQRRV
jgi:hypothetical protein